MKAQNFLNLASAAIVQGGVTPAAGAAGAVAWSSTTSTVAAWNGAVWNLMAPLSRPSFIGGITLPAGTASLAMMTLTSGAVLTTTVKGAVEYDGYALFVTPSAGNRAVAVTHHVYTSTASYTLVSQVGLQKLISTTNGAITLQPGTYRFKCGFSLSGMSSTSGAFGFSLGGSNFTTTWTSVASKGVSPAAAYMSGPNTAANSAIVPPTTDTVAQARIEGVVIVTVATSVTPQVSLGVAAAAVVAAGAFFEFWPIGATTGNKVGNW